MTRVMLGGSRHVPKLNAEIRQRLDRIVAQEFEVVVGDANGADKAFQKYLLEKNYERVRVFCSGREPRNNLGSWPVEHIATTARSGTFEFYAAKDQAMAEAATVSFMLRDGESVGTLMNVWRLVQQRKSSLVYLQHARRFCQVRTEDDWRSLVASARSQTRARIEEHIKGEHPSEATSSLPLSGPDLNSVGLL